MFFINYTFLKNACLEHTIMSALAISFNELLGVAIIVEILETIIGRKRKEYINRDDSDKFLYYRELLKEYSISEIGMIYNNSLSPNLLIALELISLKQKGKISIESNNINVLSKEYSNEIEEYLISKLQFINLTEFKRKFKSELKDNLTKKGIFEKFINRINGAEFIIMFIGVIINMFSNFVLLLSDDISSNNVYILPAINFVINWVEEVILVRFLSEYSINIKTKKGQKIYAKLNGLKRYMKDYSNFDEKQLSEITLWEDYILYAIVLGEGERIKKEVLELLKNIEEKMQ